jgi:RimJ/RimL family protein N-acetyltransferase
MSFNSPEDSIILYDSYTEEEFRGQGIYRRTLTQMVSDAFRLGAKEIYAGVEPNNFAPRHTLEKLGFTHFRTYINKRFLFWRSKKEF